MERETGDRRVSQGDVRDVRKNPAEGKRWNSRKNPADAELWNSKKEHVDIEPRNSRMSPENEAPGNSKKSPAQTEPRQQPGLLTDLLLLLLKIILIVLFLVILFTFVFGITQVRDNSMAPAIREGDLVIYYRFQKDYTAQSVIALSVDGETEIRRVIGSGGDRIDITESGLQINGYPQIESSIYTETLPYVDGITYPVNLDKDQVFVLGDNRTESKDSRLYGAVDRKATLGTVVTVIRRRGF